MATRVAFWRKEQEATSNERHARAGGLSDFILGAQDGLVNVLGVILGVAVASQNLRIILAGGLAATFAESISMGAVAYTSTLARRDHYRAEQANEMREMEELPEVERGEVREIFAGWGFEGKELEEIVDRIVSKPKAWLEIMMAHELKLAPVEDKQPRRSAFVVGVSAVVGSVVPLAPFLVPGLPILTSILWSMGVSAAVLFAVGYYKAKATVGNPGKSGLEMTAIGIASALAGFLIGYLLSPTGIA
jgi:vacuolar iron transporter family protein